MDRFSEREMFVELIHNLSGLSVGAIWDSEHNSLLGSWGSQVSEGLQTQLKPYIHQGSLKLLGMGSLRNRQMVTLLLRFWQTTLQSMQESDHWYQQYHLEFQRRRQTEQDNETLLKEVHHRVKNNLQVICSLLRLQSYRFTDLEVMAGFEDMQNRIQAMASLHERLYRSTSLRSISVKEYIGGLVSTMEQLYHEQIESQDLHIEQEISVAELSSDLAISCGLIIHELVTNALKHAFPDHPDLLLPIPHRVVIQMSVPDKSTILITVADNGVGLPEDSEFQTTSSIGLQLVYDLVDQLRGSISLIRDQGTAFQIRVPTV